MHEDVTSIASEAGMSAVRRLFAAARQWVRRLSVVEVGVLIVLVLIVVALLLPTLRWAGSGTIEFPTRVVVFDAARVEPVAGARVRIVWAPPLGVGESVEEFAESLGEYRERFSPELYDRDSEAARGMTGDDGSVVIEYRFRTGSSHRRPKGHAHLNWYCVVVTAEDYGGAVVPVRHESMALPALKEQKELVVPVGLLRVR